MADQVPFRYYPDTLTLNFGNSLADPDAEFHSDGTDFLLARGATSVAKLLVEMGCRFNQTVAELVQIGPNPAHRDFTDTRDMLCVNRNTGDANQVQRALQVVSTADHTNARTARVSALNAFVDVAGTNTVTGVVGAGRFIATVRTEADGQTVGVINAHECLVAWENLATATVTDARNLLLGGVNVEDGTLSNAVGAYSTTHTVDTGALANAYGLFIEKQTAGATINAGIFLQTTGNKLMFAAATEYIESTDAGRLDLAAATSIDLNADITIANAKNVILNTTTGTKIGTAVEQKLGFFNVTPIVQPAAAGQAALTNSTGGSADGTLAAVSGSGADAAINDNFAEVYTLLDAMRTAMVNLGTMKGAA